MTFYYGCETNDRSLGVVDLPRVIGGKHFQIKMHVVLGDAPCLLGKGWLKKHGAIIDTQAGDLRRIRQPRTMSEGESGHYELDPVGSDPGLGFGWDRNTEIDSTNNTSFTSHTFKGSRDALGTDGPAMRPLPAERPVRSDAVISMLPRKQAKQLLESVMKHGNTRIRCLHRQFHVNTNAMS